MGIGKYTGEMSSWLSENGNEVRVITTPPYYPDWKVWRSFSSMLYRFTVEDGVDIWRCPIFVPTRPKTLLRILHLISFAVSSAPVLFLQYFWRPKVVLVIAPTLFCAPQALLFSKVSGARSVLHIQDYELDAMLGLEFDQSKHGFIKKIAFYFERIVLNSFDKLSTISSGMLQRALAKGIPADKLILFPNWSELDRFRSASRSESLLSLLGLDPAKKVLLYSGNLGEKQGIELLLQAAYKLRDNDSLIFLLIGEGSNKKRLQKMALDMQLTNVVFAPLQSYDDFPTLLFEEFKGIAVLAEPQSIDSLISSIGRALSLPRLNIVALEYAEKNLDKNQILGCFNAELQKLDI